MNNDIKNLLEHRLKINHKKKIAFLLATLVSPTALLIPVPLNKLGVIWYSTVIISIFVCSLAFFLEIKAKARLKGVLKAAEDKTIISGEPTIYHLKLFGLTVSKQTQFVIETANKKKYMFMTPMKEAPAIYKAIMEARNQRISA